MIRWAEASTILKEIMHFSTKLTIKDTLLVKLILKKSRVVFYLRKIKESEQALNEAEDLLQVIFFIFSYFKQNSRNA